jgi:hypothetical protein
MEEYEQMNREFDIKRVRAFNRRAILNRNLGTGHGFDLRRVDESIEFATSLLTIYADVATTPEQMALLDVAADELMGVPADSQDARIQELQVQGVVSRSEERYQTIVNDVAEQAARILRDEVYRWRDESTAAVTQPNVERKKTQKSRQPERKAELPNMADPGAVIRYLFEAGVLTSGHSSALLLYFGLEEPVRGVSDDKLRMITSQAERDVRERVSLPDVWYRYEARRGIHAIRSFVRQKREDRSLRLILKDESDMLSIGESIINMYTLDLEGRSPAPSSEGKYANTGAHIPIDETEDTPHVSPDRKDAARKTNPRTVKTMVTDSGEEDVRDSNGPIEHTPVKPMSRLVPLEYVPKPLSEARVEEEDDDHTYVTELAIAVFGLNDRRMKAALFSYLNPDPRDIDFSDYQQGIIERIKHTIDAELGTIESLAINDSHKIALEQLLGMKPNTKPESVQRMSQRSRAAVSVVYAALKELSLLLDAKRAYDRDE